MGSFETDGLMLDEWEYDVSYVPIMPAPGYEHGQHSAINAYTTNASIPGQAASYLPNSFRETGTGSAVFQVPRTPASASRQHNMAHQSQRPSYESDSDRHARRIKRTRTACEECRKRKQKCDGGEPCQPCSEQSTECKYRDVPPTKKDDTMERMLHLAERYNTTLASLNEDIDVMTSTLRSIEARLNRSLPEGFGASVVMAAAPQQDSHQGETMARR